MRNGGLFGRFSLSSKHCNSALYDTPSGYRQGVGGEPFRADADEFNDGTVVSREDRSCKIVSRKPLELAGSHNMRVLHPAPRPTLPRTPGGSCSVAGNSVPAPAIRLAGVIRGPSDGGVRRRILLRPIVEKSQLEILVWEAMQIPPPCLGRAIASRRRCCPCQFCDADLSTTLT